jgi:hypothetical protein
MREKKRHQDMPVIQVVLLLMNGILTTGTSRVKRGITTKTTG